MPVDNNQVKGDYQDGILTLELPKLQKQEDKVTKVSIGSSKSQQLDQSQAEYSSQASDSNSAESSTDNADVKAGNGGYGNQDAWNDD